MPPNVYESVPEQTYLGPSGRQQWTLNSRGLRLKTYFWPAAAPKAVLVFAHGHGAHSLFELLRPAGLGQVPTYEGSWAQALNAAGISVAALDNQVHGLGVWARGPPTRRRCWRGCLPPPSAKPALRPPSSFCIAPHLQAGLRA